jgi:acyl carrier protein
MAFTERLSKSSILESFIYIMKNLRFDWEMEFSNPIGPETLLVADLKLESIHLVQMVVEVEAFFKNMDLPFQELLMVDKIGPYDLRVSEVVDFLYEHLNSS